jgi:hypothetical protein
LPPFENVPPTRAITTPPMSNVQYGIPDIEKLSPAAICLR